MSKNETLIVKTFRLIVVQFTLKIWSDNKKQIAPTIVKRMSSLFRKKRKKEKKSFSIAI